MILVMSRVFLTLFFFSLSLKIDVPMDMEMEIQRWSNFWGLHFEASIWRFHGPAPCLCVLSVFLSLTGFCFGDNCFFFFFFFAYILTAKQQWLYTLFPVLQPAIE